MNKIIDFVEGNLIHVNNVEKPSIPSVTFEDMSELTVGRNPMYVSNVEKPLVGALPLKY
jgi:hypothetical protein